MSTRRWHRPTGDGLVHFEADVIDFSGTPRHLKGYLFFTVSSSPIPGTIWPTLVMDPAIPGLSIFHWVLSTTNTPEPYGVLFSNPGGFAAVGVGDITYLPNFDLAAIGAQIYPAIPLGYVPSGDYYLFYGCWDNGTGHGTDAPAPLHVHWDIASGKWNLI